MAWNAHKYGLNRGALAKKASIGALLLTTCLLSPSAFAQAQADTSVNEEKPVSVATTASPAESETLPADLAPEELSISKATVIDPQITKSNTVLDRNSWDPATLTQSTGLSAASSRQSDNATAQSDQFAENSVGEGVLGSDLMSAEDLLNVGNIPLPDLEPSLAAPERNDGVINLNTSLRGTLFDLPTDNINASVFKLDLGDRLCLGTSEECEANRIESIDVGYAKNITHGKFDGLNLQLTPRAGLRFDDESKSALVGALVRVGDNLREGSDMKSNTWYFFAGADAEAVTYTPTGVRRLTSGEFHLQDRIIVGDAQAGLGYRLGSADLALTYYRRQAKAENYSYDEDAAALSLTWRR